MALSSDATLRQTCDYYVDLLALQFWAKPKAKAQIGIYVKQALGDMLVKDVLNGFDIDTAVGAQLDIIGKYVGVPRLIGDPIERPYYNFSDSDGTLRTNGFQDSTDASQNANVIWYQSRFFGNSNTALSDDAYRLVIKLQIILNSNDSTIASIKTYLNTFLPGLVAVADNEDMTLTYTLGARSALSSTVLEKFLPKPMGVRIIFEYLRGEVSPPAIAKTVTSAAAFVTVTTDGNVSVSVDHGVGTISYSWERVSGSALITPTLPFADSTKFTMLLVANPTDVTAVFRCVLTDSRGITGYSDTVSVHLKAQLPP
jgi:hypothetical protein